MEMKEKIVIRDKGWSRDGEAFPSFAIGANLFNTNWRLVNCDSIDLRHEVSISGRVIV